MWVHLPAALLLSALNVCIHALGTYGNLLWILRSLHKQRSVTVGHAMWIMLRLVIILLLLHALEVAIWAQFYISRHCFADSETAYYFSLVSYTTLGYGNVLLPRPWRMMGGWEAMIGVLMFGWSTAALVAFVHFVQESKVRKYYSAAP